MAEEGVEVLNALSIECGVTSALFVPFEINGEIAKQTQPIEELDFIRGGVVEEPEDSHVELNYANSWL